MTGRREGRLLAVQFLFQRDFNPGDFAEAWAAFQQALPAGARAEAFARALAEGVESERAALDERLRRYAEHWDVRRMSAVDRNVMRVALYEMMRRDDIPPVVSINEAVDLAKSFGGPEAGRFVNGVLDRARRDLDRPARTPRRVPAADGAGS